MHFKNKCYAYVFSITFLYYNNISILYVNLILPHGPYVHEYTHYFYIYTIFYILLVIFSSVFSSVISEIIIRIKIKMIFFLFNNNLYICIYVYILFLLPDYHVLYISCNILYNLVLFFFEDSLSSLK